jgi:hypothetical protein
MNRSDHDGTAGSIVERNASIVLVVVLSSLVSPDGRRAGIAGHP